MNLHVVCRLKEHISAVPGGPVVFRHSTILSASLGPDSVKGEKGFLLGSVVQMQKWGLVILFIVPGVASPWVTN